MLHYEYKKVLLSWAAITITSLSTLKYWKDILNKYFRNNLSSATKKHVKNADSICITSIKKFHQSDTS